MPELHKLESNKNDLQDIDLEELKGILRSDEIIRTAARAYVKILEREKRKVAKINRTKVDEFKTYVYEVYASHYKTKGELMNLIFDKNQIDEAEKGFLMREMAQAFKEIVPEYKDIAIIDMMYMVSVWIYEGNKIRTATKTGNKIHPTEIGGHYKFRWHIMNLPDDYEKQRSFLTTRVQSADNTLQNRKDEWIELEQKRLEPEPEPLIVTVDEEQREEVN